MYTVHKFMGITDEMNSYFISQVSSAAVALGVTSDDASAIVDSLDATFNTRCPPPIPDVEGVPSFLIGTNPSICSDPSCPLAIDSPCLSDMPAMAPQTAPTPASAPIQSADDSICVKYTKALFGDDTGDNELALLTAVVNLAVLGDEELGVAGILAAEGGLAPFFDGTAATANRGGSAGVSVNFLDGAAQLPNPDPSSNTAILLVHLYQFFGALLGCTAAGFPSYTGIPDMFEVHKFMGITDDMNTFFITQVGLACSGLGVTGVDASAVAASLDAAFNTRCPPLVTADTGFPAFLVGTNPSICQASSCPLAPNSPCTNTAGAPTMSPMEEISIEEPEASGSAGAWYGSVLTVGIAIATILVI